ncbi:MAG: HD domain-containing protein [Candidatus Aquicultorales bacterium]
MEQTDIFTAGTDAAAADVRNRIKALWLGTKITGAAALVQWLEESDFYVAPCSCQNHLSVPGGLALHSLHVYELLERKCREHDVAIDSSSLVICGLGHDVCKINYYAIEPRWRKDEAGRWESYDAYVIKDQDPLGHGEKSVILLQEHIKVSKEEALAIRWHMGAYEPSTLFYYQGGATYQAAQRATPLVTLLHTADIEASHLLEAPEKEAKQ